MYIDHGKNLVQYTDSYYLLNDPHRVILQPFNVQYNSQNNTKAVDTVKKVGQWAHAEGQGSGNGA